MKKIFIFCLISALCLILFLIHNKTEYENYDKYRETNEKQSELFADINPINNNQTDNLADARKINPEITAWLEIPETDIDFPIVQCSDNEFYLSHNFEKAESDMGVPFLDYRNTSDFSDFNSIIYGHNIKNYMFSPLINFKDRDYFNSHSNGYLTLKDKKYKINFIACMVTESDSFVYNTIFLSKNERLYFLETIKEKALYFRDFEAEEFENAQFCTLSTCSYEFSDARTVLIGYLEEIIE